MTIFYLPKIAAILANYKQNMLNEGTVMTITLNPGELTLSQMRSIVHESIKLTLNPASYAAIDASFAVVNDIVASGQVVYGINTGFGLLANKKIPADQLADLQTRLVLSHATGTGDYLPDSVVRLMLALKINGLARGYSGIRREVIDMLLQLYNHEIYPCIPEKGSVGASGDLAPLAHLSAVLLGVGEVRKQGKIISAQQALAEINLKPITLAPKEGLALLNGTQASTALALAGLFAAEDVFAAAIISGCLSVDALQGSDTPFDDRIHAVRGQIGQRAIAKVYRDLLQGSALRENHKNCNKVQDPYSLRCQPQVMGACLDQLRFAAQTLVLEANAVSDNPLVFAKDKQILSGGNFHAEPVAMAADNLALAIAEVGSIAERRIALLVDPNMSGLPAFLVAEPGLNSGFMIAQVTAAALTSENKSLAHPGSVDNIPTSANQEDHVSMATFAARRLTNMAKNSAAIIGIELLAAAQGIYLRAPLRTAPVLHSVIEQLRKHVAPWVHDRYFAPDIEFAKDWVMSGYFDKFMPEGLMPSL